MRKNLISSLLFFTFFFNSFSQQTADYTNQLVYFEKALKLYQDNQFLAAQTLFINVDQQIKDENIKSECAYYIANCAIRLNQQDADLLMENFVTNYPTSIKKNSAYIVVANYYFSQGKYAYARKWYAKVDASNLSKSDLETFNFNNGYAFFKNKNYKEAKKYFNQLSTSTIYGAQAKYYLGFMAYQNDDYEEANQNFEEVKNDATYSKDLSYYQADMNFKLGKFQKAIDLGKQQYQQSTPKEKSELSKIIGESYFNLQQYEAAIPYLKNYKGKRGKWNNTDYYQLGYAYYQQKDYQNAIDEFNKIIHENNQVGQNAYYHLADSYLHLKQKQQALNAFKNASEMDFNPKIQEDAHYNYAKLSYEIGNNYQSIPKVLLTFIEKYPKNSNIPELKELLINSYITSKNYQSAFDVLEKNKSIAPKDIYQKVAFFRGIEIYNESNFNEAIIYFNIAINQPEDPIYTAKATYWKAESQYQLSQFEESLASFQKFIKLPSTKQTTEYQNTNYHLAYNYFKLKQYQEAISFFQHYVETKPQNQLQLSDAFLRLADCHFVESNYWKAIENYNKAVENEYPNKGYALFQKAISYGFVDRTNKKIETLTAFIKNYKKSVYLDDAFYEIANTYGSQNQTNKALENYDALINQMPKSSFIPKALLKKALLLDNTGKSNEALQIFKQVAQDYSSSPEALQAVTSAKNIYIDQGNVSEYGKWIQSLDFIDLENEELDDASYLAAEQPYLENKTKAAIQRFETYLLEHPEGKHTLKAHFYLAQLYYKEFKKLKAQIHYLKVANKDRNEFTEQALVRVSELYLEQQDYNNALTYLERLETEADFPQNIIFAQTNMMKINYEQKNYFEAVVYAEKVLQNSKIENKIKSDSQIIIARSAMKTGDENKAKLAYQEVAKIATGKLAAEALYYDAYFKNQSQQYKASNILIQQLAKDYSGYKYFGAKGLLLMANNFYQLKDSYQATYILESVITNFSNYPEIVDEAKKELASIKKEEAKTNSSIEIED
ncbi:MAG: tetratricopeptide repeat protein [Flavobacteriales bacterium]